MGGRDRLGLRRELLEARHEIDRRIAAIDAEVDMPAEQRRALMRSLTRAIAEGGEDEDRD